jgi:hypothetical protein
MGTDRRRLVALAALVVVVVGLGYRAWTAPSGAPSPASNEVVTPTRPAPRGGVATQQAQTAPDVHLQSLGDARPKPGRADRNLFRFRAKSAPPGPPVPRVPLPMPVVVPAGPPPPPPLPQIPLKFIGTLERAGQKIAILSDATGHVSFGPEGATIEGRYRIIRIGAESVEMAYVDGRGRQMIRLTGG